MAIQGIAGLVFQKEKVSLPHRIIYFNESKLMWITLNTEKENSKIFFQECGDFME